jgi:hypothetical protein
MKNDNERVNILFHNRAGEAMLSLYREFQYSVAAVDRQGQEDVFQQQRSRYTTLLKSRLDGIAMELMNVLETSSDRNEWSHSATRFIQEYMNEFAQKIRSL